MGSEFITFNTPDGSKIAFEKFSIVAFRQKNKTEMWIWLAGQDDEFTIQWEGSFEEFRDLL